ncbi:MAG: DUF1926 domain-containing protein, partial [Nitrospira sp.]|nr:DUF1926 domain-containing protein [Nitrospira sp.]
PTESGNLFEEVLGQVKQEGKEDAYKPFLRGGFWRNFLEKYPESNNMHKKMLRVSNKVAELSGRNKNNFDPVYIGMSVAKRDGGLPDNIHEAYLELWRGQVNCPYWHGIFGGLYLGHLRNAVYNHLIKAEKIADEAAYKQKGWIEIEAIDFDCDGSDEIVVTAEDLSFVVDVHKGGMLTELDYRPASYNFLNTLSRRPEVYHKKIIADVNRQAGDDGGPHSIHDIVKSKEADLHLYLQYDSYRRGMLVDHVYGKDATLEAVIRNGQEELGGFPWIPYTFNLKDSEAGKSIFLEGEGLVNGSRLSIRKEIKIENGKSDMVFNYTVKNISGAPIDIAFGSELNFAMLDGNSDMCQYDIKGISVEDSGQRSRGESRDIESFNIKNMLISTNIGLSFSRKCTLWRYPVETISQSESGFEREYQSSVIVPHWNLLLNQGEEWSVEIKLTFRRM